MHVARLLMLMQECCNPVLGNSFANGKMYRGCVPIRIKHFLHSSAVRYGEILHLPSAREISKAGSRGGGGGGYCSDPPNPPP